jgi:hypothetical protein
VRGMEARQGKEKVASVESGECKKTQSKTKGKENARVTVVHVQCLPLLESIRVEPILSISSMKMMEGECWRAITNNSRTYGCVR